MAAPTLLYLSSLLVCLGLSGLNAKFVLNPLFHKIKSDYNPHVAPVKAVGQPVEIEIVFQPINVAHVDETNNAVEMEAIVLQTWDSGIVWNPLQSSLWAIEYITVPKEFLWLPPLNPFQAVTEMKDLAPPVVTLFHNGTAVWYADYNFKLWCDVAEIATTGATCTITTAIWGYSKDRVAFNAVSGANMEFVRFFQGSRYTIEDYKVSLQDFPSDGRVYQFANFQMTIKEKPHKGSRWPFKAFFEWH